MDFLFDEVLAGRASSSNSAVVSFEFWIASRLHTADVIPTEVIASVTDPSSSDAAIEWDVNKVRVTLRVLFWLFSNWCAGLLILAVRFNNGDTVDNGLLALTSLALAGWVLPIVLIDFVGLAANNTLIGLAFSPALTLVLHTATLVWVGHGDRLTDFAWIAGVASHWLAEWWAHVWEASAFHLVAASVLWVWSSCWLWVQALSRITDNSRYSASAGLASSGTAGWLTAIGVSAASIWSCADDLAFAETSWRSWARLGNGNVVADVVLSDAREHHTGVLPTVAFVVLVSKVVTSTAYNWWGGGSNWLLWGCCC